MCRSTYNCVCVCVCFCGYIRACVIFQFLKLKLKLKVFGAMASSYLRLSSQFYGTGESCLFSFEGDKLEVFPWTGLNSYFTKGNTDSIAIGSGE